jgi:hypothetical protein
MEKDGDNGPAELLWLVASRVRCIVLRSSNLADLRPEGVKPWRILSRELPGSHRHRPRDVADETYFSNSSVYYSRSSRYPVKKKTRPATYNTGSVVPTGSL